MHAGGSQPAWTHNAVWDKTHPRAFNVKDHPSLLSGTTPRKVTAAHALVASSPALVGIYPASDPSKPYPLVFVPPESEEVKSGRVKSGFYVVAQPGEEFVVRVGGRGGMDAVCCAAASELVLVNVYVDGMCANDPTVLERNMDDIADEVFHGFATQSAPGQESRYKRFAFAKTPLLKEGGESITPVGEMPSPKNGPARVEDVGTIGVQFATAIAIQPESDGESQIGTTGVRVSEVPDSVSGVCEQTAAKHGVSVGVGAGAEVSTKRCYTKGGVCFGENLNDMDVTIFLRERWWMEAKGLLATATGKFVKDEVGDATITLRPNRPAQPENEPLLKHAKVEVINLDCDEEGAKNGDGSDGENGDGSDRKNKDLSGVEKKEAS